MSDKFSHSQILAAEITKSASRQTYYTIQLLADRDRAADAYRAYGYFRWVDDVVDDEVLSGGESGSGAREARSAFVSRQQRLLESCYRGEVPSDLQPEEWMLVDLVRHDTEKNSGLHMYLHNMMDVMIFDAERRGRVISQTELFEYSRKLAIAVTEALYYFIGHNDPPPAHEARYLAVTTAHITHMLRDALEDVDNGYFNVPQEYLQTRGISPRDVTKQAYREWVCGRVQLARGYFKMGRECTAQIKNLRCRLAGLAYIARFEWMLRIIERDNYCLRSEYPERKSLQAVLWMVWSALLGMVSVPLIRFTPRKLAPQPVRIDKR